MNRRIPYEELLDSYEDQQQLISLGRSIMHERDSNKLLRKILDASRQMTGADAGSIFLVEDVEGHKVLRFKYSHTTSKPLPYEEFIMPQTMQSIAGYVSLVGESLNIADVYKLDKDLPYEFNYSFDRTHGYRTKSVLAVPMLDYTGGVVGVIQLLNSKECLGKHLPDPDDLILKTAEDFETKVFPFKGRYVPLMEAVASYAAISLENANMIKRIQYQFEEFVYAAVEAIEERDPATKGHSYRVAISSMALADAINKKALEAKEEPPFNKTALEELELAAVLHDFGKVYIEPSVFLKGKKLYPEDLELLKLRHKYLYRSLELCKEKNTETHLETMQKIRTTIEELNEPRVMDEPPEKVIDWILNSKIPCRMGIDGEEIHLLTDNEILNLSVARGSLNPHERALIQQHVVYSYDFAKRIPWPPQYKNIPKYVRAHHEMLDGSGYPDGLKGDEIPPQAQIMTIADIYDALTASDRPYKVALSMERALAILKDEAERGKLNAYYVELFAELTPSLPEEYAKHEI